VNALVEQLTMMSHDELIAGGVTNDGCRVQVAALRWNHEGSIQQTYSTLACPICVPCLCHRLNNSLLRLFKSNAFYSTLISVIRACAVVLWKPSGIQPLRRRCPVVCETRWVSDYPIVCFLTQNYDPC
jgi:hypothetical protein